MWLLSFPDWREIGLPQAAEEIFFFPCAETLKPCPKVESFFSIRDLSFLTLFRRDEVFFGWILLVRKLFHQALMSFYRRGRSSLPSLLAIRHLPRKILELSCLSFFFSNAYQALEARIVPFPIDFLQRNLGTVSRRFLLSSVLAQHPFFFSGFSSFLLPEDPFCPFSFFLSLKRKRALRKTPPPKFAPPCRREGLSFTRSASQRRNGRALTRGGFFSVRSSTPSGALVHVLR